MESIADELIQLRGFAAFESNRSLHCTSLIENLKKKKIENKLKILNNFEKKINSSPPIGVLMRQNRKREPVRWLDWWKPVLLFTACGSSELPLQWVLFAVSSLYSECSYIEFSLHWDPFTLRSLYYSRMFNWVCGDRHTMQHQAVSLWKSPYESLRKSPSCKVFGESHADLCSLTQWWNSEPLGSASTVLS